MTKLFTKREFLAAGVGGGLGLGLAGLLGRDGEVIAQTQGAAAAPSFGNPRGVSANLPRRRVTTTPIFRTPEGFPNAMQLDPDGAGIWVGEQKMSGQNAITYGVPEPEDLSEAAWLLDWNGNLLKTVMTESRNTSGMAVGGGYIWMVANAAPNGVFQTDMNSRTVSHRQVPLGGGGNHGAKWHEGKLWIVSTRMRAAIRIDPETWEAEYLLPLYNWDRLHDMAFDDEGALWVVTGTIYGEGPENHRSGLAKYELPSGRLVEYAEFDSAEADAHGLEFYDGAFYSCDAGIHPGWPTHWSPMSGYVFRIDLS